MGLSALVLDRRVRYTLEDDAQRAQDDEGYRPTVFLLTPPTAEQLAVYQDMLAAGRLYQGALHIVRECLAGWENLIDPRTGSELPVPETGVARADRLASPWRVELACRIEELGTVPEEDFGSSDSALM